VTGISVEKICSYLFPNVPFYYSPLVSPLNLKFNVEINQILNSVKSYLQYFPFPSLWGIYEGKDKIMFFSYPSFFTLSCLLNNSPRLLLPPSCSSSYALSCPNGGISDYAIEGVSMNTPQVSPTLTSTDNSSKKISRVTSFTTDDKDTLRSSHDAGVRSGSATTDDFIGSNPGHIKDHTTGGGGGSSINEDLKTRWLTIPGHIKDHTTGGGGGGSSIDGDLKTRWLNSVPYGADKSSHLSPLSPPPQQQHTQLSLSLVRNQRVLPHVQPQRGDLEVGMAGGLYPLRHLFIIYQILCLINGAHSNGMTFGRGLGRGDGSLINASNFSVSRTGFLVVLKGWEIGYQMLNDLKMKRKKELLEGNTERGSLDLDTRVSNSSKVEEKKRLLEGSNESEDAKKKEGLMVVGDAAPLPSVFFSSPLVGYDPFKCVCLQWGDGVLSTYQYLFVPFFFSIFVIIFDLFVNLFIDSFINQLIHIFNNRSLNYFYLFNNRSLPVDFCFLIGWPSISLLEEL
jgi:hypothetical protein